MCGNQTGGQPFGKSGPSGSEGSRGLQFELLVEANVSLVKSFPITRAWPHRITLTELRFRESTEHFAYLSVEEAKVEREAATAKSVCYESIGSLILRDLPDNRAVVTVTSYIAGKGHGNQEQQRMLHAFCHVLRSRFIRFGFIVEEPARPERKPPMGFKRE